MLADSVPPFPNYTSWLPGPCAHFPISIMGPPSRPYLNLNSLRRPHLLIVTLGIMASAYKSGGGGTDLVCMEEGGVLQAAGRWAAGARRQRDHMLPAVGSHRSSLDQREAGQPGHRGSEHLRKPTSCRASWACLVRGSVPEKGRGGSLKVPGRGWCCRCLVGLGKSGGGKEVMPTKSGQRGALGVGAADFPGTTCAWHRVASGWP